MWIKKDKRVASYTVDDRGSITLGAKIYTDGKEKLLRFDHFKVSNYPEIINLYGDQPKDLLIEFPNSGRMDEVVQFEMIEWATSGIKRRCDKETMTVLKDDVTDEIEGKRRAFQKGEHPCNFPNCKCRSTVSIIARVLNPQNGKPITGFIRFNSGSARSGNNILTQFEDMMSYGETPEEKDRIIRCFYWKLTVVMKRGKIGKVPTLQIQIAGIKQNRNAVNLLESSGVYKITDADFTELKLIAADNSSGSSNIQEVSEVETSDNSEVRTDKEVSNNKEVHIETDDKEIDFDEIFKGDKDKRVLKPKEEPAADKPLVASDKPLIEKPKPQNPYTDLQQRVQQINNMDDWKECLFQLNESGELTFIEKRTINEMLQERKKQLG